MKSILVSNDNDWQERARSITQNDPGFTQRFANLFERKKQSEYESGIFDPDFLEFAHSHGFLAENATAYNLCDCNITDYLSDYDYFKLWPLNGPFRIWINDKLTLRHILPMGARVMPKYYYYFDGTNLKYSLDIDRNKYPLSMAGLLALLKDKKDLALKQVTGSFSEGFRHIAWDDGLITSGQQHYTPSEFEQFVRSFPNCAFTDYLKPHDDLAAIDPKIHTIRLIVVNSQGDNPLPAAAYIRFGTEASGEANYNNAHDADAFNYFCLIDIETGNYGPGFLSYPNKRVDCPNHPDSKKRTEGKLPDWQQALDVACEVSLHLSEVEWMGFDIGLTNDGPRIMEINSHPMIKMTQVCIPAMRSAVMRPYLENKLAEFDTLDSGQRAARFLLQR